MEANTAIAEGQWHGEKGKQIRELPVLYSHLELEQCVLGSLEPAQGTCSVRLIAGAESTRGGSLRWIPEARVIL